MIGDITHADRLCRLFCNVIDEVITRRALELTADSLSRAQFGGLQYIYLHPRCCIKDLAQGLDVSHPAAVKLVERLEARKLITRSSSERDRRVVQLEVTTVGRDQAHQAMAARTQAIEKVLYKTGDGLTGNLLESIEAFVAAALADERDMDGVCLRCGGNHVDSCPVCQAEIALTGEPRRDG